MADMRILPFTANVNADAAEPWHRSHVSSGGQWGGGFLAGPTTAATPQSSAARRLTAAAAAAKSAPDVKAITAWPLCCGHEKVGERP
jgi:hypothetical protein